MKRWAYYFAATLAVVLGAAPLRAAETLPQAEPSGAERRENGDAPNGDATVPAGMYSAAGAGALWYVQYIDRIVGLSDSQKAAMTEIIQARDKAMARFRAESAEEIKTAGQALHKAFQSKDRDAIAQAQQDYQALFAPLHEIMRKAENDLANVLTPEQKSALRDYQLMSMIRGMTFPVQLDDAQIRKIKDACGESDPRGLGAKLQRTLKQVMTPEQKTRLHEHRLMAMVGGLTAPVQLNEEQLQRIRDAFQDADADPRMRGHELQEMLKHVLTPEQKTKIVASRGMNYVKLTFRRAKLTDEQLQRVAALCR